MIRSPDLETRRSADQAEPYTQALVNIARAYSIPADSALTPMVLRLDTAAREIGAAVDRPLADAVRRAQALMA